MSSTENEDSLPPPPPVIPSDVMPDKEKTDQDKPDQEKPDKEKPETKKVLRIPIARRGLASVGSTLQLYTNHFRVNVGNTDGYFFQYSVSLFYEDGRPVDGKGVGRKVLDKVQETYDSELDGKNFAYDGEKTLFTLGSLPRNLFEFTVVLEDVVSTSRNYGNVSPGGTGELSENDKKRMRRPNRAKTFKVEISFASKIPLQAIANALHGQYSDNYQEAIRVFDIILRQHAAKQGCLLVRQSFFYNDPNKFTDVGGGVLGCNGFHSSFRTTQSGLSLNIDVSTTMIVTPGPVVDFLISNQNAKDPFTLDWGKAKRTLKNLRIKASPSNQEYKITGLSDLPCKEQTFTLKKKGDDATEEVTVYDYFVNHRKIDLRYSGDLPCINVGKPKRPTYIPLELCSLVSLQRYTKALSTLQRSSLVEKSRQKPLKRIEALKDALSRSNYGSEPMLRNCGISINSGFTVVEGRVLQAPRLKFGNSEDNPRNGRWNFNQKTLVNPTTIKRWAVVNFSARCEVRGLVNNLLKCAEMKGISIEPPVGVFEEDFRNKRAPPHVRVGKMLDMLQPEFDKTPNFILCLLPERKNSDLYGPWKKISLVTFGMFSQCIAPPQRVNDQYLTNVLLKINAKLGGLNSMLSVEYFPSIPIVSKSPTLIIGMDVSHGPPGQTDIPSIAAVVSSREWPLISKYRAFVRTQSPKLEMIDNLFKRVSDKQDNGIIRALLCDFFQSSGSRKPDNIIIFRDGVSESQFNQVLNIELDQIIEACKFLDDKWSPKFLVIVAQKNHHTRFFHTDPKNDNNVPPGTVIDNKICHPRNYDFYMCAHNGAIGTSRPTHYHVLLDEIGFSPNDLQQLVHALSYVYQRSTTAISVVAPICYAHLAASQMAQLVKFEERSETASSHDGAADRPVPQLPVLHDNVCKSMFFC